MKNISNTLSKKQGYLNIKGKKVCFFPKIKSGGLNYSSASMGMGILKNLKNIEVKDKSGNIITHRIEFQDTVGSEGKLRTAVLFKNIQKSNYMPKTYPNGIPEYVGIRFDNRAELEEGFEFARSSEELAITFYEGKDDNGKFRIDKIKRTTRKEEIVSLLIELFGSGFGDIIEDVVKRREYFDVFFGEGGQVKYLKDRGLNIGQIYDEGTPQSYFLNSLFNHINRGAEGHKQFWGKDIIMLKNPNKNDLNNILNFVCYQPLMTNMGKYGRRVNSCDYSGTISKGLDQFDNGKIFNENFDGVSPFQLMGRPTIENELVAKVYNLRQRVSLNTKVLDITNLILTLKVIESISYGSNKNIDEADFINTEIILYVLRMGTKKERQGVNGGATEEQKKELLENSWTDGLFSRLDGKKKFTFSDGSEFNTMREEIVELIAQRKELNNN